MRLSLTLVFAVLLLACHDTGSSPVPAADPAQVARAFFEAVGADDQAALDLTLSEKARVGMSAEGGFALDGAALESFELDEAVITGERARVPARVVTDGTETALAVKLRHENGAWVVTGLGIDVGGSEWPIDFEGEVPALEELGEQFAQQMAEGMQEAFSGAMAEWQNGGAPEEIAAERSLYRELRSVDEAAHDAAWRIAVRGGGRSAREVLDELVGDTGLRIDEGLFAERFERTLELELTGVSRLAAIEELCAALTLRPVYPEGFSWSDELPALTFRELEGSRTAAFAGPFRIEVSELVENAPHTTGKLTLAVRALGLAPAVVAANREMAEGLTPEGVHANDGTNLLADPDTQYMGAPDLEHGMLVERTSLELCGLLSGVRSFTVTGRVALLLPKDVAEVRFDPFEPGLERAENWSVSLVAAGAQTELEVTHEGGVPDTLRVGFAPDDAQGEPLGMQFHSANAWNGKATVSLQTNAAPAALAIKLYDTRRVEYAFRIEGVPLVHAARQPAALQALAFEGATPVEVRFRAFAPDSEPDFPKAVFQVTNRTNKDVLEVQADLEYLDSSGKVQGDFPSTLSGEPRFEGPQPLAAAGASATPEMTVFFVPEGTTSIRARVRSAKFVDGTRWEAE